MKPTLVINAGGGSRRMGQTKALLPVPPNHQPLLLHIVDRLAALAAEPILVVANDPQIEALIKGNPQFRYITDCHPGEGPLGGLLTALPYCPDWAMVVACDMPLVNPAVFDSLIKMALAKQPGAESAKAVIPHVGGRWQPLHGLYHRGLLPVLQATFSTGERSIQRVLNQSNVTLVGEELLKDIDPQLRSFVNVNTPEEWDAIQSELGLAIEA